MMKGLHLAIFVICGIYAKTGDVECMHQDVWEPNHLQEEIDYANNVYSDVFIWASKLP